KRAVPFPFLGLVSSRFFDPGAANDAASDGGSSHALGSDHSAPVPLGARRRDLVAAGRVDPHLAGARHPLAHHQPRARTFGGVMQEKPRRPPVPAPKKPTHEKDQGFNESHGWPPGHGGPTGPGDEPAAEEAGGDAHDTSRGGGGDERTEN